MNTLKHSTRAGLAATFAALILAATACGTEQGGANPAASINQAGGQKESRISPRAAEHQAELQKQSRISPRAAEHQAELQEQARKLAAERADAKRAAHGQESTAQPASPAPTTARQGSPKFPDLLP
jgi:hypothetical protein